MKAVNDRTSRKSRWRTARRRYVKLVKIIKARPQLRDKNELERLSRFVADYALPFLKFWGDVIENQKPLDEITNAPPWGDMPEELERDF